MNSMRRTQAVLATPIRQLLTSRCGTAEVAVDGAGPVGCEPVRMTRLRCEIPPSSLPIVLPKSLLTAAGTCSEQPGSVCLQTVSSRLLFQQ